MNKMKKFVSLMTAMLLSTTVLMVLITPPASGLHNCTTYLFNETDSGGTGPTTGPADYANATSWLEDVTGYEVAVAVSSEIVSPKHTNNFNIGLFRFIVPSLILFH